MITETYVSFEVAKLLKEKGFDEECYTFYEYDSGDFYREERFPCCNSHSDDYAAPTQQRAMKWLREKYNICITIYPDKEKGYEAVLYHIKNNVEIILQSFGFYGFHIFGDSYEEACETAIKYCLENPI